LDWGTTPFFLFSLVRLKNLKMPLPNFGQLGVSLARVLFIPSTFTYHGFSREPTILNRQPGRPQNFTPIQTVDPTFFDVPGHHF
jgi:hypothetical protein